MELFHYMVPEDEILLCGAALFYGIVLGVVARLLTARISSARRRAA